MWVDWGLESYLFLTKLYLANGCGDMFHRERSVSVVLMEQILWHVQGLGMQL